MSVSTLISNFRRDICSPKVHRDASLCRVASFRPLFMIVPFQRVLISASYFSLSPALPIQLWYHSKRRDFVPHHDQLRSSAHEEPTKERTKAFGVRPYVPRILKRKISYCWMIHDLQFIPSPFKRNRVSKLLLAKVLLTTILPLRCQTFTRVVVQRL